MELQEKKRKKTVWIVIENGYNLLSIGVFTFCSVKIIILSVFRMVEDLWWLMILSVGHFFEAHNQVDKEKRCVEEQKVNGLLTNWSSVERDMRKSMIFKGKKNHCQTTLQLCLRWCVWRRSPYEQSSSSIRSEIL